MLTIQDKKIRYPLKHEMEKCYPNLEYEIINFKPYYYIFIRKTSGKFCFRKEFS